MPKISWGVDGYGVRHYVCNHCWLEFGPVDPDEIEHICDESKPMYHRRGERQELAKMNHYAAAALNDNGTTERLSVIATDKRAAKLKLKVLEGLDSYTGFESITQNEHHRMVMSGMAREVK